jgi:hypothetical protein
MVKFETMESKEVKWANNFIEVSRKKAVTEESENFFISLSRGFFTPEGEKRYRKNFTIPAQPEVVGQIIEALQGLQKE